MAKLHSINQFHPVGHGTFFSGQITLENEYDPDNYRPRKRGEFLWVFDCGSNRSTILPEMVRGLRKFSTSNTVGMLCISHFDNDHVNGLKDLLSHFYVEKLILPYASISKRLELVSSLDDNNDPEGNVILFGLDPAGALREWGLDDQVGSIVLVKGGAEEAGYPEENMLVFGEEEEEAPLTLDIQAYEEEIEGDDNYFNVSLDPIGGEYLLADHRIPATVAGVWEFIFYNKDYPDGVAPKSGVDLAEIAKEVRLLVAKKHDFYEKKDEETLKQWRDDLRACYERHFGTGSVPRNDISLCVLSRPLIQPQRGLRACRMYNRSVERYQHALVTIPLNKNQNNNSGLLLTGDISLDSYALDQMEKFFSTKRWLSIHVMQIPHHGSEHSWHGSLAKLCPHSYSVLCVPDTSANGHHPSKVVVSDLSNNGKSPLFANYCTRVVFAFHIT